ncbi:bifunctional (p)ppGpp synthetase/guanosine-3',5'-bis(diphosphate) 3'-pyrophosphohydrolase [Candidatus Falkowbacteria bacterium]|nr:bifunctional (p)ppGpp synthetase/guanosine-3',5'-bis(diphosphate) 3'-pyrophosphohydrolase [Candidatus Falkowbacteria bacterium]
MDIGKIIEIIKEKQPTISAEIIEKAYQLLNDELERFDSSERKILHEQAVEAAIIAAEEKAQVECVCACLFFDLAKRDENLHAKIENKLGAEIGVLVKCYNYAEQKLREDRGRFDHSYRTALKVASIRIGLTAVCTALMHELPYHCHVTIEEIAEISNKEIAELVQHFQKLLWIKAPNNQQYISHLREMVVAMAADLRVIIIKMCSNIDRLKNRTLPSEDALKICAIESKEILAPLADLLGIWKLRWQLEDYSFKILESEEYEKISRRFNIDEKKNRDKYIQKTKNILEKAAADAGIACQIDGRFKHFYSIYTKMKAKKKSFDDICDVFALRVIVNSVDDCYRIVGIIHRLWRPRHRRFKDYIAAPKNNHYQSLHTTVFGLNGRATEFQIRTRAMNEEANYGIAAHWYYKNLKKKIPPWIQELLLKQQQYKNDEEFWAKFSSEILNSRIYVYTPKGDVISLPSGATPVDFAYHIHSEIGNKCAGAVVNDIQVSLDHQLATNDVVQITVDRAKDGPSYEWLKFVKTNAAKKHIEDYFNKQEVERRFRL